MDELSTQLQHWCKYLESQPRAIQLRALFSLTEFEWQLLVLSVSNALDLQIRTQMPHPTLVLAMQLFEDGHGDALTPYRALRYWRLLEIIHTAETPYTHAALRIDERILHYVMGYDHFDERLQPFMIAMPEVAPDEQLPPSQVAIVAKIVALLRGSSAETPLPILQLSGIDAESKRLTVQHVSSKLDATLYHLPTDLIPQASHELDLLGRLWEREGELANVALFLDAQDLDPETQLDQVKLVQRFLVRSGGLFFLSVRDAWNDIGLPTVTIDVEKPTTVEQEALWADRLGAEHKAIASRLAAQFNLSAPAIERVGKALEDSKVPIALNTAWSTCLEQTRPWLDKLAQRIIPKATWDDIVLPDLQLGQLHEIAAQVENRNVVYDSWGWRQKMTRGLGTTVMFGGESGTGKTFAAEILANHLKLNLYRIDLSQVVSKYIGETEKNLRKLFDAAEDGGANLFFDEADSLFGKRSEAKSSNDRYANMETNYLLQRLEQYRGLAILATNLLNNIDEAFMRRVRFVVKFPVPDEFERATIWGAVFPEKTPLGELDYQHLSQFKMAGGSIYNAALNASFRAASDGGTVEMPHILAAIQMEFDKVGRLSQPKLFEWPQS